MPITTIIALSAIVAAFLLFAAVLAWGEMQTRHLSRDNQQRARKSAEAAVRAMTAKAQEAGARSATGKAVAAD
jgi:hypothetical protein